MSTPEVSVSADAVEVAARAIVEQHTSREHVDRMLSEYGWGDWLPNAPRDATAAITAALPVLRAEWEKPLRELADLWWITHHWSEAEESDGPLYGFLVKMRAALDALPGESGPDLSVFDEACGKRRPVDEGSRIVFCERDAGHLGAHVATGGGLAMWENAALPGGER